MNPEQRKLTILKCLEHQGVCSYGELAESLEVSSMTVRRDIEDLSNQGMVIKVLGGAQRTNPVSDLYESQLVSRLSAKRKEKKAIAEEALQFVEPGETLFLDGSTTCLEFAKVLDEHRTRLTVITNSLLISQVLGQNGQNTVIVIGGQYESVSLSCVGSTAEDQVRQHFVDKVFLSTKKRLKLGNDPNTDAPLKAA